MLSFSPENLMALELAPGVLGDLWHYRNMGSRSFLHHHAELELNFVLQGTGTYLAASRRYELTPGALVWLFPGQDHVLTSKSSDLEMWIGVFRPELLESVCRHGDCVILRELNPEGEFCKRLNPPITTQLSRLCQEIVDSAGNIDRFNAGLGYLAVNAWEAYQNAGIWDARSSVHPAVQRALNLLRMDDEDRSIAGIAALCGLSVSRLSEVFKQQTGATLTEFRSQQRLERFFRLYNSPANPTMLSAALDAGFGSYLQFYRVFREAMGRGPAEYKRRRGETKTPPAI